MEDKWTHRATSADSAGADAERAQSFYLTKIDAAHNMRRFYLAVIQPTILGHCCLVRIYGRIGRSAHIMPPVVFGDPERAYLALERLVARKRRRGYV